MSTRAELLKQYQDAQEVAAVAADNVLREGLKDLAGRVQFETLNVSSSYEYDDEGSTNLCIYSRFEPEIDNKRPDGSYDWSLEDPISELAVDNDSILRVLGLDSEASGEFTKAELLAL